MYFGKPEEDFFSCAHCHTECRFLPNAREIACQMAGKIFRFAADDHYLTGDQRPPEVVKAVDELKDIVKQMEAAEMPPENIIARVHRFCDEQNETNKQGK